MENFTEKSNVKLFFYRRNSRRNETRNHLTSHLTNCSNCQQHKIAKINMLSVFFWHRKNVRDVNDQCRQNDQAKYANPDDAIKWQIINVGNI